MNPPSLDQKTSLQVRRRFPAPRERVFRAWIEREALLQWWGRGQSATTISQLDPRVGGGFRFESAAADGSLTVTSGRYLEIDFPIRLVFTWTSSITGGAETLVTIDFLEQDGSTEIVLTHQRFANAAMTARHQQGWTVLLERLAGVV